MTVATAAIISEQYGKVMLTTGGAEEKTYKLGPNETVAAMPDIRQAYLGV